METVDILAVVDGLDHALLRYMAGKRQLHYIAVDLGIGIEASHGLEQFLLGHRVLETDQSRCEPAFAAGLYLMRHIGLASAVVPHEHCGQMRAALSLGHHCFHFGRDLTLYVGGYFFPVNKFHVL